MSTPVCTASLPFLSQYVSWWEHLPFHLRATALVVLSLSLITGLVYIVFVRQAPFGQEDDKGFREEDSKRAPRSGDDT
jgi:hypothetical protein